MTPPAHAPAVLTGVWVERPKTIIGILDRSDEHRDYYPGLIEEARLYEEARSQLVYEGGVDDPTDAQVHLKVREIVDLEVDVWCSDQIHDFLADDEQGVERLRQLAPDHPLLLRVVGDRLVLDPRRARVWLEDDTYRGEPTYRINVSHPLVDELVEAIEALED